MTVLNCAQVDDGGHAIAFYFGTQDTWTELYNASSGFAVTGGTYPRAGYSYINPSGASDNIISRGSITFDTSGVPATSIISQVVLKGQVKYLGYGAAATQKNAYMRFCRLTAITWPGGEKPNLWARYAAVKDALIQYGYIMVTPAVTTWTNFELTFNDYALGDIVKGAGGVTWLAMRIMEDSTSTPDEDTDAGVDIQSLSLDVTYDTVPGALAIVTLPATEVTKTTATLNGEITAGSACKRGFDWGEGTAMDNEWYESGTFGVGEFSHAITGLTEDTRYCFRAKGEETPL